MKIAVCGDIHICKASSIVRSQGVDYSTRLENCIKSINWFEQVAKDNDCEVEVFLGDTFEKPELDDETITAVKTINWNNLKHYFIIGNHESSAADLRYSSVKILEGPNRYIIDRPVHTVDTAGTTVCFWPYEIESNRHHVLDLFPKTDKSSKRIIFSHNDIKGIQMGVIRSTTGIDIEEIDQDCDLFVNGHIHTGGTFGTHGINLGILTGQNFGEDALAFKHRVMIIDTETLEYKFIENPYAFGFVKYEINSVADIDELLSKISNNTVLSLKCLEKLENADDGTTLLDILNRRLESDSRVIEYRVISVRHTDYCEDVEVVAEFTMDYLSELRDFAKEHLGTSEILLQELNEICK